MTIKYLTFMTSGIVYSQLLINSIIYKSTRFGYVIRNLVVTFVESLNGQHKVAQHWRIKLSNLSVSILLNAGASHRRT